MAFNLEHCIEATAAGLEALEGAGRVHRYRRLIRTESDARRHLFSEELGRITGWIVTPSAAATSVTTRNPGMQTATPIGGGGGNLTTYQIQIEGFAGIDDEAASEVTFRTLAERVIARFNAIGKLTTEMTYQLPADIETFGYINFAGVFMLHFARINVGFQGRVAHVGA